MRFPEISDEVIEIADEFFQIQKEKTRVIMESNLDSEINYLFTNDEAYLKNRTRLIPVKDKPKQNTAQQQQQQQQQQEKEKEKEKESKGNLLTNFMGIGKK